MNPPLRESKKGRCWMLLMSLLSKSKGCLWLVYVLFMGWTHCNFHVVNDGKWNANYPKKAQTWGSWIIYHNLPYVRRRRNSWDWRFYDAFYRMSAPSREPCSGTKVDEVHALELAKTRRRNLLSGIICTNINYITIESYFVVP